MQQKSYFVFAQFLELSSLKLKILLTNFPLDQDSMQRKFSYLLGDNGDPFGISYLEFYSNYLGIDRDLNLEHHLIQSND